MDEVLIEITEIAPVVVPDDVTINITEVPNEVVITASSSEPDIIPASTALYDFLTGTISGAWVVKTLAQVKTILGLGSSAYIDLDANNRFVTDTEKGTWNGKQPAGSYLVAADIAGKVDKVTGSSLLANTELTKLQHRIKYNFLK